MYVLKLLKLVPRPVIDRSTSSRRGKPRRRAGCSGRTTSRRRVFGTGNLGRGVSRLGSVRVWSRRQCAAVPGSCRGVAFDECQGCPYTRI